jgi:hypothetical protein
LKRSAGPKGDLKQAKVVLQPWVILLKNIYKY